MVMTSIRLPTPTSFQNEKGNARIKNVTLSGTCLADGMAEQFAEKP